MDINEIKKMLDVMFKDRLVEIRAVDKPSVSGYFKNHDHLIDLLSRSKDGTYYIILNKIKEECYAREQCERFVQNPKNTTSDNDISRREWVLIDADPVRVTGVSASDEEKAKAKSIVGKVHNCLRDMGFAFPVVADSGNGYHLLYRVDFPTNDEIGKDCTNTVKKFLIALDMLFSTDEVKIDTAVFNASRITKLYGTNSSKGTSTADRPHRQSKILRIPDKIELTTINLFKKVAEILPKPEPKTYKNNYTTTFDIDDFMSKHGLRVSKESSCGTGKKYILEYCPFDSGHKAPDAAVFVLSDGSYGFHCFHNSCSGKSWRDVRLLFEPDAYDKPKTEPPRTTKPLKPAASIPQLVENHIPKDGLKPVLQLSEIKRLDRSKIISVKSGFKGLDSEIIGFNKGEFSIWSGGNGSGKSTVLNQLAIESIDKGFKVLMFSGELTPDRVKQWLWLQAAGRQFNLATEFKNYYFTPENIGARIDEWTKDKFYLYNNEIGLDIKNIFAVIQTEIEKKDIDVVIIDNLMSIDMAALMGDKYENQTKVVMQLSKIAKKYNVHVHFVCHPRKPMGFLRKTDISGTADITNAADNVFMMHRVNDDFKKLSIGFFDKTKITYYFDYSNVLEVMKNRDLGVEGVLVGLYFEPQSKRYLNELHEYKNYGWNTDAGSYEKMPWMKETDEDLPEEWR